MKELKTYVAQRGVQLDADFTSHVAGGCEQCHQFDPERPATAAVMCLEGSVLYTRIHRDEEANAR